MKAEQIIYYDGSQKLMGTFFPNPNRPLLILFPAFEGFSDFSLNYASFFQKNGYQVFIADMYGDRFCGKTLNDCFLKITPFLEDRSFVRKRALHAYEACTKLPSVDSSKIGSFGFCFGGMCALELARSGAPLTGIATIHGILKKSSLKTNKFNPKALVFHGMQDPQVPMESLQELYHEIKQHGTSTVNFMVFGEAKHSFSDPKTGSFDPQKEKQMGREYNQDAAALTQKQMLVFFNELFS